MGKECSARQVESKACAEVCVLRPGAEALDCAMRPADPDLLRKLRRDGYVCNLDRCFPAVAQATKVAQLGEIALFETLKPGAGAATGRLDLSTTVRVVPGIIPPQLWEWATGGNCCEDCWAKHRNLGLDCLVDTVCCAGTCGIQPGCNGGGGGGAGGGVGDGPDGGGGGDGESCGATRDVHDATIQYNGQTCSFDGKVHPTWVDGKCVNVAGEGVIYACDGVDGFVFEDPTETETPGP